MEEELDSQIEKILTDARLKINKLVLKHSSKLLKEQAKALREPDAVVSRRTVSQPKRSPDARRTNRDGNKHILNLKDLAPAPKTIKPVRKLSTYDSDEEDDDDDEDSD